MLAHEVLHSSGVFMRDGFNDGGGKEVLAHEVLHSSGVFMQDGFNDGGGKEVLVPSRFLYGIIPQCLLVPFRFWRDEASQKQSESIKGGVLYLTEKGHFGRRLSVQFDREK